MSSKTDRDVVKTVLKSLPIWEPYENFDVKMKLLQNDLKNFSKKYMELIEKTHKLPSLNITTDPLVEPKPNKEEREVVKIYQKIKDDWKEVKQEETKPSDDSDKGMDSLVKLERKFRYEELLFCMVKEGEPWIKCSINKIHRTPGDGNRRPVTIFQLKNLTDMGNKVLKKDKHLVARVQNHGVDLRICKRVIAGPDIQNLKPGIIGFEPQLDNYYRYLVFMDDGTTRYFKHSQVFPIVGQTLRPWEDVKLTTPEYSSFIPYVNYYFSQFPCRRLLQASIGEKLELTHQKQTSTVRILKFDCDIMKILYEDKREEWIFRGDCRISARAKIKAEQFRNCRVSQYFPRICYWVAKYHEVSLNALDEAYMNYIENPIERVLVARTARKSTGAQHSGPKIKVNLDSIEVEEDRTGITLHSSDLNNHRCKPSCLEIEGVKTELDVKDFVDEFRDVGDLKVPLLLGWTRKHVRLETGKRRKWVVIYWAPCGRAFQQVHNIRYYLIQTGSRLDLDYFSFDKDIVLNRRVGETSAYHYVKNIAIDARTGKPLENKNISLVNRFNEQRIPSDFEYRADSFPHPLLKAKGFSFNEEFKSSCDCGEDCMQRSVCACQKLNEEAAGTNAHRRGVVHLKSQYTSKRLIAQVNTGIFECNSLCKCSSRCANRVVQNGIRVRLQVEYTLNKGWGVITLDDIPAGAFICTYAAELLDDADQYGDSDMYYADLDYITVNEEQKGNFSESENDDEGVDVKSGEDSTRDGKRRSPHRSDDYDSDVETVSESSSFSSSTNNSQDTSDIPRKSRGRRKNHPQAQQVRFKRIHDLLGSHDYTLDARMQGNIGRFFNHSCDPNAFVQNVFIESHDLRFPVVAFFANKTIKAYEEIHWNYNYKMGSIEGRRIDCHCMASNCRGRIL